MKGHDTRRHPRIRIEYPVHFSPLEEAGKGLNFEGLSMDVGPAGMCFTSGKKLKEGTRLHISCEFLWGGQARPASVVYCLRSGWALYRVGVAFTGENSPVS
jgi:hypothetical protein